MKRLLSLLLLASALVFAGCQSAEQTAFVTIGSVGATANAAIGAYSAYLQTHTVPPAQVQEVRKAVQAYLAANETARAVVTSYKAGTADKAAIDQALDAVAASSGQLVALVNSLTQDK